MTTAELPVLATLRWDQFLTMSASVRWVPEPTADTWEIYPLAPQGMTRVMVVGHAKFMDESHEYNVQVALVSQKLGTAADVTRLQQSPEFLDIARSVHSLVWDRVITIATTMSGLMGSANMLHRREEPASPLD